MLTYIYFESSTSNFYLYLQWLGCAVLGCLDSGACQLEVCVPAVKKSSVSKQSSVIDAEDGPAKTTTWLWTTQI